jgi:hypothetical protein
MSPVAAAPVLNPCQSALMLVHVLAHVSFRKYAASHHHVVKVKDLPGFIGHYGQHYTLNLCLVQCVLVTDDGYSTAFGTHGTYVCAFGKCV